MAGEPGVLVGINIVHLRRGEIHRLAQIGAVQIRSAETGVSDLRALEVGHHPHLARKAERDMIHSGGPSGPPFLL